MNCAKVSFTPSIQYGPLFLGLEAYLAKNAGLVWLGSSVVVVLRPARHGQVIE